MDDRVHAFAAEARCFCTLVEDAAEPNPRLFAQQCLAALLRVFERALHLPEVLPGTADLLDRVTTDEWAIMQQRLGGKLALDHYWLVYEPLDEDQPEPVVGLLSDDLADVWRDLKDGLLAFDGGDQCSVSEAVWHWRNSFETHWARHASAAVAALNALCYGQFGDAKRPHSE